MTKKLLSVVYSLPSFDPSKGVDYYNSNVPRSGFPFKEGEHEKKLGKATNKVLVGKPVYKSTSSKLIVQIPYFAVTYPAKLDSTGSVKSSFNFEAYNTTNLEVNSLIMPPNVHLCFQVTGGAGKQVGEPLIKQTELRLVRLQYPYLDSTILAQYVAMNASKYNFTRMQKTLFNKVSLVGPQSNKLVTNKPYSDLSIVADSIPSSLPSNMMGLKVELAGQLTTQRSIPRKTVSNYQKGSFNFSYSIKTNKANNSGLNFTQYTSKNKLGAFTIKVWLSDASS